MKRKRLSILVTALAAMAVVTSINGSAATGDKSSASQRTSAEYFVTGITTSQERSKIAATGALINGYEDSRLQITATPSEVAKLRSMGYTVGAEAAPAQANGATKAYDFPAEDSGFHNYAEMTTEINNAVSAYPNLISKQVIGKSYQNRDLIALKISDNASTDEDEPEVIFTFHQHAREHLTVEMALYLIKTLTSTYSSDNAIKNIVDNREIWILPDLNPDGGEFDISTGQYAGWRLNRQPNSGSSAIGTDMNRNWKYKWGCCGGSSTQPGSETYRGPSAESSPEVKAVADFTRGRVINGKQQITMGIDFHTFSELVMWPYGYTNSDTDTGLSTEEHKIFSTIGREMAAKNNYTPQQSSDLYITDGTITDWMWGEQRIWHYTYEMFPRSAGGLDGFYPDDEVIGRETARNKEAVLLLLGYADCPKRSIGQTCGAPTNRTFENANDVQITDQGTVTSDVTVTGVSGNASSTVSVDVNIKHTYRGDLVIDLVAPDGTAYRVKEANGGDGADNVVATYTVNASAEAANGTWKLRVQDAYKHDVGYIDSWKLTV